MRMLATITEPTEGTVKWNDVDIVQSPDMLRYELGYLPHEFGVYPNLAFGAKGARTTKSRAATKCRADSRDIIAL